MTARQVARPPLPVPAAGSLPPGWGRAKRRLRDKPWGPNTLSPLYPLSAAAAKCSGARRKVAELRGAGGYLPGSRNGSEVRGEAGAGPGAGCWRRCEPGELLPSGGGGSRSFCAECQTFPWLLPFLHPRHPFPLPRTHMHTPPANGLLRVPLCVCVSQLRHTPTAAAPGAGHSPGHQETFNLKSSGVHAQTQHIHRLWYQPGTGGNLCSWTFRWTTDLLCFWITQLRVCPGAA